MLIGYKKKSTTEAYIKQRWRETAQPNTVVMGNQFSTTTMPSITPAFVTLLGQTVLDFGFMEGAIRLVLTTLTKNQVLAKAMLPSSNSVSQNLELLKRVARVRVVQNALPVWMEAADDIQSLFEQRNRFFHGMFIDKGEGAVLGRHTKGKRGAPDAYSETLVSEQDLRDLLKRLSDRRRQLMDFVDDYRLNDNGPAHEPSQEAHPSLSILAT